MAVYHFGMEFMPKLKTKDDNCSRSDSQLKLLEALCCLPRPFHVKALPTNSSFSDLSRINGIQIFWRSVLYLFLCNGVMDCAFLEELE